MGEEPSYGVLRAEVRVSPPLPRLAPGMFPSSPPSPSIIAHLNTTLFPRVRSSLSGGRPRAPPAVHKAPLLQWTFHNDPVSSGPPSHLPTPPGRCSLPPVFISTPPLLQNPRTSNPRPNPPETSPPLPSHTFF
jgi:hypothetical protein